MHLQDAHDQRCIIEALEDNQATAQARAARRRGQLDGDMTVESLPTVYRGNTFRSALEASWAATLDSLSLRWEYEPKTVTLPSGEKYLPDFHLPDIGTWIEVKGTGVPRVEKAFAYGQSLACGCVKRWACQCDWPGGELVLIGHPPRSFDPWTYEDYDHWPLWSKNKLAWRHGGFARWESTRGTRCWLTRCPDCQTATWFDIARCRACGGRLPGAEAIAPGDDGIQFIPIRGVAPNADHAEEDRAA